MSGSKLFHYRLFGLSIGSEIELPELTASAPSGEPDVTIRCVDLSAPQDNSEEVQVDEAGASFSVQNVARYRVAEGCSIFVDSKPNAPQRNIRLFLLGSAMGLLLHQRGILPLHANTIEIGGCGYAFMGPSGAGKSTLAAAFHDRGYRVVADDVCAIRFNEVGIPVAHGGAPRMRLWEDALVATGRSTADYQISYAGDEKFRKFDVPTRAERVPPVQLAAIIELAAGDEFGLARLGGLDAVESVFANTYRGGLVCLTGNARAHWETSLRLVSAVPVFRLRGPKTQETIARIIEWFENDQCLVQSA